MAKTIKAVIDTNIFVSALLRSRSCLAILSSFEKGEFIIVLPESIIEEVRRTLTDEALGISIEDTNRLLKIIQTRTEIITHTIPIKICRDPHDDKIIDVGAGSSVFVDELIKKGYRDITVLDISSKALQHSKERLGERAQKVKWVEADITNFEPKDQYSLWHDRAVLHFLTAKKDRENYVRVLETVLKSGGHVIIATFNLNGPPKCSGLPVERYDARKIQGELGKSFEFVNGVDEVHMTPGKIPQNFTYFYFRKK